MVTKAENTLMRHGWIKQLNLRQNFWTNSDHPGIRIEIFPSGSGYPMTFRVIHDGQSLKLLEQVLKTL